MSDQVLQSAVLNCDKESAFEERKTRLRSKALKMVDLKNDHNKSYEELSELGIHGPHSYSNSTLFRFLNPQSF